MTESGSKKIHLELLILRIERVSTTWKIELKVGEEASVLLPDTGTSLEMWFRNEVLLVFFSYSWIPLNPQLSDVIVTTYAGTDRLSL
jgi:hypothetical protein